MKISKNVKVYLLIVIFHDCDRYRLADAASQASTDSRNAHHIFISKGPLLQERLRLIPLFVSRQSERMF